MNRGPSPMDPFDRFEGFSDIRIPRPPRRFWIGAGFLVAALAVVLLAEPVIGVITETQWYMALGIPAVYITRLELEAGLFFGSLLISFVFAIINIAIALKVRSGPALRAVGIRTRTISGLPAVLGILGAAAIALLVSAGAGSYWQSLALFLHVTNTGVRDPVFHLDVSFYLLVLPFLHQIVAWVMAVIFLSGLAVGLLYAWHGETFDIDFSPPAIAHISALFAMFLLVYAVGDWIDRYDLVYAHDSVVWGAGYADIHARIGVLVFQVALIFILTLVLLANVSTRRRGILIGVGAVWLGATFLSGLYAPILQRLVVEPAELTLESPYIAQEITFTRRAFGLDNIQSQAYDGSAPLTAPELDADSTTIQNLRLWDNSEILDTYNQLQSLRTYYSFDPINLDRYTINGEVTQVEISAREIDQQKLPSQAQSWVNEKLEYTHGYSVAASPVDNVVGEGLPDYIASDIPTTGPLKVTQPDIYFGVASNYGTYVLAPSAEPEFDYPSGNNDVYTSYQGSHGVKMTGINRALWSLRTGDFNLLISDQIQNRTEMLYRTNVIDRVSAIAPFLTIDSDPYIVVGSNGRLYWIIDAYTTASTYPYSQDDSNGENYIRNSVKIVVDAYEGTATFYVNDPTDPIIRAYAATFPSMFKPLSAMPAGLVSHLRVPQYYFNIQAQMYATYHISSPRVLYNQEDIWSMPLSPYYVEMRLPGQTQTEYLEMVPFTPLNNKNLVSWLAVRMDPGYYGQMIAYVLPKDKVVLGPLQILNTIDTTPTISRDITLLNASGSQFIQGNLLVVPVANTFLYFEPVYLRANATANNPGGGLPEVKSVILSDATGQTPVAYQPTLQAALQQLVSGSPSTVSPITGSSGSATGGVSSTGTSTTTGTSTGSGSASTSGDSLSQLVTQALQDYQAAQQALQQANLAGYGTDMAEVNTILQQIQQLQGTPTPSPGPTP